MTRATRLTWLAGVIALTSIGSSLTAVPTSHAAETWPVSTIPDCTTASDEYCVDKLGFTPQGSSTEVVFTDAVPTSVPSPSHPNTYVSVVALGGGSVYGRSLTTVQFNLSSPTSTRLGTTTETGIPAGTYRLVLRTGKFKPHSMTIKGRPVDTAPFKVTSESDGTHLVEITARAEALVLQMDPSLCRNDEVQCEASNAFVKALQGLIYLVAPDTPEAPSPVSPSLETSQGLWIANNSILQDVKPEMNLVTKALSLPAYGPHYVPTDFPTVGLTAENGRYLNPAYFEVFVPARLSAFMANFNVEDVATKLPSNVRATIEKKGVEVPAAHVLNVKPDGGLVSVTLDHYSAPNPRVYVGSTSGTSSTTTSSTVVGTSTSSSPVTVKIGRTISRSALASSARVKISTGARVTVSVSRASKSFCSVIGTSVKGLKKGACSVTMSVTPKATKTNPKPTTTRKVIRLVVA